jgi:hypothetical protein
MDVEKVKLIVKNLESLVRCLKEELYMQEQPDYVEIPETIFPSDENFYEDYDEVFLE